MYIRKDSSKSVHCVTQFAYLSCYFIYPCLLPRMLTSMITDTFAQQMKGRDKRVFSEYPKINKLDIYCAESNFFFNPILWKQFQNLSRNEVPNKDLHKQLLYSVQQYFRTKVLPKFVVLTNERKLNHWFEQFGRRVWSASHFQFPHVTACCETGFGQVGQVLSRVGEVLSS